MFPYLLTWIRNVPKFFVLVFRYLVPCGVAEKFGSSYLDTVQQPQEQRYPFLSVRVAFSCVQTMVWLPVFQFEIVNVRTDVVACDRTRGLYEHRALELVTGRWIVCRTGDSNPRQYCAWLFSRTLYQLSYPRPRWLQNLAPNPVTRISQTRVGSSAMP